MRTLSLNEMEIIEGGINSSRKCRVGVAIGCALVGVAFGLATSPLGGFLARTACNAGAWFSGYCNY